MTQTTVPLEEGLPVVWVSVGTTKTEEPAPSPLRVRALIDTGASHTFADPAVVSVLRLDPVGSAQARTATTDESGVPMQIYELTLGIYSGDTPTPIGAPAQKVVAANLASRGFHMILGRDLLSECLLIYNGGAQILTLAY